MRNAKDLGSKIVSKYAGGGTATAGGTGDDTKVEVADIDRLGFQSGVLVIAYSATLAAGKKLSFTAERSDADAAGGTYDTAAAIYAKAAVATGAASTGSTEVGVIEIPLDLSGDKRFEKIGITPDLDATGTDACFWTAALVLGGSDSEPV